MPYVDFIKERQEVRKQKWSTTLDRRKCCIIGPSEQTLTSLRNLVIALQCIETNFMQVSLYFI